MSRNLDDRFNAPVRDVKPATLTREDIMAHLKWSKPEERETKFGPRIMRRARASVEFRELWLREESTLRAEGYTLREWPVGSDKWEVAKWDKLPPKVIVDRQRASEMSRATDAEFDPPAPDGVNYFGYQKAGIAFTLGGYAAEVGGVLIADEPGLGKTIQAIGVVNCLPEAQRILVICPASVKENWRREIERWQVVNGEGRRRPVFIANSQLLPDMLGWVVVNYDVLHKHEDVLARVEYDVLICDEAHKLKGGGNTRRGKMVFGIKATGAAKRAGVPDVPGIKAKRRLFLTGTPIVNRPAELFPLINYLDPNNWPDFFKFGLRYCDGKREDYGRNGSGWNFKGASNLFELQSKLRSTIMIRRLKKDVLTDLPPKIRKLVTFEASGRLRDMIKVERSLFGTTEQDYKKAVDGLQLPPALKDARATFRRECAIETVKMTEVRDYVEDAIEESGKIILFIWHVEVGRLVKEWLGDRVRLIMGDTPMNERQAAVDEFQEGRLPVICGGILPMGVGLTLTAASRVIFLELDDVPGNVSQAEDRAHRIGQTDSVLVEHLVVNGTLSAAMAQNCIIKQEQIDKALDQQKNNRDDRQVR